MINVLTLNKIAACGTSKFGADYAVSDNCDAPEAVMVRSAKMHDMEFKDKLLEHYESQSETIEKFRHMLPYEEWTEYTPN